MHVAVGQALRVDRAVGSDPDGVRCTIVLDNKLYHCQIQATDAEIDALVYELYALTEEEIAIVEGRDH